MSTASLLPRSSGRTAKVVALAMVVIAGLALSACSSSPSASSGGHKKTGSGHHKSGSTTTTTMKKKSGSSLADAISKLASGQAETYSATYSLSSVTDGKSENGTMTVAHSGSDSLFAFTSTSGTYEEIVAKKKLVVCAKESSAWQCYGGSNLASLAASLTAVENAYSAKGELSVLKAYEAASYGVSSSTKTVAGVSANCLTYHSHVDSASGTVCFTGSGELVSSSGTSTNGHYSVTLEKFASSVPASTFTVPAKVTPI